MIQIKNKAACTGCWACANICPVNCINMLPDEMGFLYPAINEDACINCGLCEKTCPVISDHTQSGDERIEESYAVRCKDPDIRMNSSSGGVFSLLAREVIREGGTVFGAALDESHHARHVCARSSADIIPIRGSKIIQSNIGFSYQDVKRQLDNGKKVLFTGTPCQISGLLHFLGKRDQNLITQDIICHGVCSSVVYDKYLSYMEGLQGSTVESIQFRNKSTGWRDYAVAINFKNGDKTVIPHGKDKLMRTYLKNYALRPSCYDCRFKGKNRPSDITLADFWGIEHIAAELDDNKGVSFVVCHSDSGEQCISKIKPDAEIVEVNYEKVIKYNMSGECSVKKPNRNDEFCKSVVRDSFSEVIDKYCRVSLMGKMKRALRSVIKTIK